MLSQSYIKTVMALNKTMPRLFACSRPLMMTDMLLPLYTLVSSIISAME